MKVILKKVILEYIKSFKYGELDLTRTKVIIGQNDHGKSSILKVLNIIINEINQEMLDSGILSPDIAEKLLTIFNTNARARRITINYDKNGSDTQFYISIRTDFTFIVHSQIKKGINKSDLESIENLKLLQENIRYIMIPAIRDVNSLEFLTLFANILDDHGLKNIIPRTRGGTTKEYRQLKKIKDDIAATITPYIQSELLSILKTQFSINTIHPLSLAFDVDVYTISNWLKDNLKLAFSLDHSDAKALLPLGEAGTGIQSAVLLALHSLKNQAEKNPDISYIYAIEEPEAFLHPQKQKELYSNLIEKSGKNLSYIVTTHSPYIIGMSKFSDLALVRKEAQFSEIFIAEIANAKDREIFDSFSDEINSQLFFAEKVIFVEGESDKRVIETLLKKKYGSKSYNYTIISVGGNKSFSPYLKMLLTWKGSKIPFLIVTDFDSLTKETERAILRGIKDSGYRLTGESDIISVIDGSIDKSENEYREAKMNFMKKAKEAGVKILVINSDLEFSLINDSNKNNVSQILNEVSSTQKYLTGYSIAQLQKLIGSKMIPINSQKNDSGFKKPFIHKKISDTIELESAHEDIRLLINTIDNL